MKIKNLLVIGAGLMLVGGLLAGITYTLGAQRSMTWDHGPKLIEMGTKTTQVDSSEVKKLVIHTENQGIEIRRGLNFEVNAKYIKGYEPKITTENGILTVNGAGSTGRVQVSLGDTSERIVITIPRDKELTEVAVATTDGSIEMEGINSKKFQIESYDTWLDLSELRGETLSLNQQDSHLEAEHLDFSEMHVTGSDNSMNIEDLTLRKASSINVNDGHVSLENISIPGFLIQMEDGHLLYNDEEIQQNPYEQGDQKKALAIDMRDGQLSIDTED
ncbi:hypothetical protein D920_01775 [Enterococcus faecalis 13-SD-W-01]|nr:hypothetical protein D920_01775 [Enterococcus faecalis 13-SD-W-01]